MSFELLKSFGTAYITLATGGRAIITSTPNNDDDTFASIWKQACRTFDETGE